MICAASKDSDQLAYLPSDQSIRCPQKEALSFALTYTVKTLLDCVDVQADQSLLGAHDICSRWLCHRVFGRVHTFLTLKSLDLR